MPALQRRYRNPEFSAATKKPPATTDGSRLTEAILSLRCYPESYIKLSNIPASKRLRLCDPASSPQRSTHSLATQHCSTFRSAVNRDLTGIDRTLEILVTSYRPMRYSRPRTGRSESCPWRAPATGADSETVAPVAGRRGPQLQGARDMPLQILQHPRAARTTRAGLPPDHVLPYNHSVDSDRGDSRAAVRRPRTTLANRGTIP